MGQKGALYFIKRYWLVTLFPTFMLGCIYADWSHTRKWKKELARQTELQLNN